MKTVITDHPFPDLKTTQDLFSRNGIELDVLQTRDLDKIIAGGKNADALIVGMAPIGRQVLSGLERCKAIVRLGVGFDNIDVAAATERGIMVINLPDFCTEEVSDHAMAFIVMTSRRVLQGRQVVREGKWGPPAIEFEGFKRLREQTVGFYAFGRIARDTAAKARNGFKMTCVAYDPFLTKEQMAAVGVEKVDMPELLRRSDFISLHAPLTKETENAFGVEQFRAMKRTAWIINTSRGPVINEKDLVKALDEKLIAGAALDVLAKEPPDKNHPLLNRENVIVTPHMAAWTWDSREELQRKGAEEIVRALTGVAPLNVVNRQALAARANS